jgi:cytochrome c oxidase assembly protein subunit 15
MTTAPEQSAPRYRPWLHRYAMLLVAVTFVLIVAGGTVTSKGVGMAVPDWPTSYGYNMFLFPPSMWRGGVFWEHTHRLLGSLVGVLTIGMAAWLWLTQPPRGGRPWLRWLGIGALMLVIVQGVMGGLRVTEFSITLAIIHGITAQLFLCVTVLIAAATGKWWHARVREQQISRTAEQQIRQTPGSGNICCSAALLRCCSRSALRIGSLAVLLIVVIQLALGAAMRHTGAGLAIPDFPASYGRVIPPLTQDAIHHAIDTQTNFVDMPHDFTPAHVGVHFAHRAWALLVAAGILVLLAKLRPLAQAVPGFHAPALALVTLLLVQIALGASVIWSGKHPEVATAHQATGAVLLATLALLVIRIHLAMWRSGDLAVSRNEAPSPSASAKSPNRQIAQSPNPTWGVGA